MTARKRKARAVRGEVTVAYFCDGHSELDCWTRAGDLEKAGLHEEDPVMVVPRAEWLAKARERRHTKEQAGRMRACLLHLQRCSQLQATPSLIELIEEALK